MVRVALLSRVTFTTATLINRYCVDFYTHFSRLLPAAAVRFAWGGRRPPEYNHPPSNPLIPATPEPGGNRPWQSHCPGEACPCGTLPAGTPAARRGYAALPDPRMDTAHYAIPDTRIP